MILIDTNVIIDIFEHDATWFDWSAMQLDEATATDDVAVNIIIVAELSRNFVTMADLQAKLAMLSLKEVTLDAASAFQAGKKFQTYRAHRRDAEAGRVLPDFFIGAHALTLGASLLTRDARLYRRYFPDLTLITPETDHG